MTEFTDYATLRIYIPPEYETLRSFYRHRIEDHNNALFTNLYADSGFDLGMPTDVDITKAVGVKLPLAIHCSMYSKTGVPQGFSLLPRSSIIKTPLRLSNSVGVIDRGYRGPITAVVDNLAFNSNNFYKLQAMDRYFQLVHPSYNPFKVVMVDSKEALGSTNRGEGGFGSTGR